MRQREQSDEQNNLDGAGVRAPGNNGGDRSHIETQITQIAKTFAF
jgi:hypothetical protein